MIFVCDKSVSLFLALTKVASVSKEGKQADVGGDYSLQVQTRDYRRFTLSFADCRDDLHRIRCYINDRSGALLPIHEMFAYRNPVAAAPYDEDALYRDGYARMGVDKAWRWVSVYETASCGLNCQRRRTLTATTPSATRTHKRWSWQRALPTKFTWQWRITGRVGASLCCHGRSTTPEPAASCAAHRSLCPQPFCHLSHGFVFFMQPRIGMTRKKSMQDEALFVHLASRGGDWLTFVDARPKSSAMANQARGGGSEVMSRYPDCQLLFENIGSIHVMRNGAWVSCLLSSPTARQHRPHSTMRCIPSPTTNGSTRSKAG